MSLSVEIKPTRKDACTIIAKGSIDEATYLDFQKKVQVVVNQNPKSVLLDMGDVKYISSVGLGAIFDLQKKLKAKGAQLVICNLRPHIRKAFEIVKAFPPKNIFASVKEADRYLDRIMRQEIQKYMKDL